MVVKMADKKDGISVDLLDVYSAVKMVVNWDAIMVAL